MTNEVEELAVHLICMYEDIKIDPTWGTALVACKNEEHSGDCVKQPWTCNRCVAEEFIEKAKWLMALGYHK